MPCALRDELGQAVVSFDRAITETRMHTSGINEAVPVSHVVSTWPAHEGWQDGTAASVACKNEPPSTANTS